nr:PREDICTED: fer-1-like protein 4 [Latimeria chalumnae]|eukprot:XP_005986843.1 PREDICTED: fer-1-like protein 4 [Latimeria chalumnae]
MISLQHLITSGRLNLKEALVDKHNSLTDIYVELEIRYQPIQGAIGNWLEDDFAHEMTDSSGLIIRNVGYVDPVTGDIIRADELDAKVRAMGKKLVKSNERDDDDDDTEDFDFRELVLPNITFTPILSRCKFLTHSSLSAVPKVQHFQVTVNILEAQKLVGVNIDPVVYVKVGDEKKHTPTQKSTNCPFYNESFMFEFQEPREVVLDKIVEISVLHAKKIPFTFTRIGTFKIDLWTIYNNQDHQFFQKWAVLTDPSDTRGGVKGFVKCNISVLGRGDVMGPVNIVSSNQNDDIEKNLLLPKNMPAERPWAKFYIKIFRAEGLPSMNSGFMGSFSKIIGDKKVFVDPYVQVTFAGQQGETSVETNTTTPEWNEQITFIEMFPPLARRIKVQILDDANISGVAVATHFIELDQISDSGRNGFKPTFGPAWVNLYGSPQNSTLRDVHMFLNEGLGEGIFCRGRILMSVFVEVYNNLPVADKKVTKAVKNVLSKFNIKKKSKATKEKSKGKGKESSDNTGEEKDGLEASDQPSAVTVDVDEIHHLPEDALGKKEEFLLFGAFFEAAMIDPCIGSKLITFEMSIGNYGKAVEVVTKNEKKDGKDSKGNPNEEMQSLLEPGSEDELDNMEIFPLPATPMDKSMTPPKKAQPTEYERLYSCIPMLYEKPCVYVWSYWEDHSWRLYNSNWIVKMADRLENGLGEVEKLLKRPKTNSKEKLKQSLEEFVAGCRQYVLSSEKKTMTKPNNLDKCRAKLLTQRITVLAKRAMKAMKRLTNSSVKDKLNDAKKILKSLRFFSKEPQSTLPDVFIWMMNNNKRIAYTRIPSQNILFSVVEEEKGKDCGKIQTVYFKSPGAAAGEIFAKVEVYLWLGVTKYMKNSISSLPEEFQPVSEEATQTVALPRQMPPIKLTSDENCYFQLRAHLYQARGILPADESGLSDPFARVVFMTQCQNTRVIDESLSPMWNELLLFDQIVIEGNKDDLRNDPPVIAISLFDQDRIGAPEFLGRTFAAPIVTLVSDQYNKPTLQFFDIYRGHCTAGELIAAFELIELNYSGFLEPSVPDEVNPKEPDFLDDDARSGRFCIPEGVRPVLRPFRLEVLFWGLRHLKRVNLFEVDQPQVVIECAGHKVESEVIPNYKLNPNFDVLVKTINMKLPEQIYLHPPLSIYVVERRIFGRTVPVGAHVVTYLMEFAAKELREEEDEEEAKAEPQPKAKKTLKEADVKINVEPEGTTSQKVRSRLHFMTDPLKKASIDKVLKKNTEEYEEEKPEAEELDWWSKYYASLEEMNNQLAIDEEDAENDEHEGDVDNLTSISMDLEAEENAAAHAEAEQAKTKKKLIATLQIYNTELETQFDNFQDWLYVFPLHRGKANEEEDDADDHCMGKYKGSFLIYPTDEEEEEEEEEEKKENKIYRILQGIPRNRPIKVLVRVYVVKATNLSPTDPNGKADPYVVVKVEKQVKDSKERYIPKQLNPVFGEVFELSVNFPLETELTVSVFDHDMMGSDDLIGETKIDLENRFYSNHRAICGLASQYDIDGYNMWRDAFKPTQILAALCRKNQLPEPEYRPAVVKVNNTIFKIPNDVFPEEALKNNKKDNEDQDLSAYDEQKALYVLRTWHTMPEFGCKLVPEHVEVRSLYNEESPGMAQGSVHMWIDMFPNDVPAPAPVNIKPRLPISYELRLIIWNTDDVVLDDINPFTGTASSDIYVKGWIKGLDNDKQETDVHFNSLTGEGNFNWRFVFRFDYLPTEKEITFKKKESFFSLEESEFRQPAVLVLQVWDYDRILSNDFLGSIELKLNDMIRGAKSANQCTIKMFKEKAGPRFSIFRNKRMRGWWPFVKLKSEEDEEKEEKEEKKKKEKKRKGKPEDFEYKDASGNTYILTGKVEAEFQLVTVEEAEKSPVGLGRKEPEPLELPNRPKTSFNWFLNPLKTFIYFIWKNYKKYIIALLIIAILALFLALILYTLPGEISKQIVNG